MTPAAFPVFRSTEILPVATPLTLPLSELLCASTYFLIPSAFFTLKVTFVTKQHLLNHDLFWNYAENLLRLKEFNNSYKN